MKVKYSFRKKYQLLTVCNEKGFILPFTLFLFFLFSTILLHSTTKYVVEKQVFNHINETYKLESLLLLGFQDVEQAYESNELSKTGLFDYDVGYVKYTVKKDMKTKLLIGFECYSDNKGELFMDLHLDKKPKVEEEIPEEEVESEDGLNQELSNDSSDENNSDDVEEEQEVTATSKVNEETIKNLD